MIEEQSKCRVSLIFIQFCEYAMNQSQITPKQQIMERNKQEITNPLTQQERQTSIHMQLQKVHEYCNQGRIDQAIAICHTIIQYDNPQQSHQICGLGSIADQRGYYQNKVCEWYVEMVKLNRIKDSPYDALSLCYSVNRKFDQAQKCYRLMLGKYPDNLCLHFGLANVLHNKGNISQAISEYQNILRVDPSFSQAYHQLALISFTQNNLEMTAHYLQMLKGQSNKNIVRELLQAMVAEGEEKKVMLNWIIKQNSNYARAYLMMGVILQQQQQMDEAISWYIKCLNIQKTYKAAYLSLINIYSDRSSYIESIKCCNKLIQVDGFDVLSNMVTGVEYLKHGDMKQAEIYILLAYKLVENRQIYLGNSNQVYLMGWFGRIVKNIKENKMLNIQQSKRNSQIYTFVRSLQSSKQQNLNTTIQKLRLFNPELIRLIIMVADDGFQFKNKQLFHQIYSVYEQQQICIQLISIISSKFITKNVCNSSLILPEIQTLLFKHIQQQIAREIDYISPVQTNEDLQFKTLSYEIKHTGSEYDYFQNQFFSSYKHIYMKIKKIHNNVKKIVPQLEELVNLLKNQLKGMNQKISIRITSFNQYMTINQIMQEILPEIVQRKTDIMKKIDDQMESLQEKDLPILMKTMLKVWEQEVTTLLKQKHLKNQTIKCCLVDFVQAECAFGSQTRTIKAIQLLQRHCLDKGYEIMDVIPKLQDKDEQAVIFKIRINEVSCTINLAVNKQSKYKRSKKQLMKLINLPLGCVFNSLLSLSKKYHSSFLQHCCQLATKLKYSSKQQDMTLLRHIQFVIKDCDVQKMLQSFYNDIMSHKDGSRDYSKYHKSNSKKQQNHCHTLQQSQDASSIRSIFKINKIQNNDFHIQSAHSQITGSDFQRFVMSNNHSRRFSELSQQSSQQSFYNHFSKQQKAQTVINAQCSPSKFKMKNRNENRIKTDYDKNTILIENGGSGIYSGRNQKQCESAKQEELTGSVKLADEVSQLRLCCAKKDKEIVRLTQLLEQKQQIIKRTSSSLNQIKLQILEKQLSQKSIWEQTQQITTHKLQLQNQIGKLSLRNEDLISKLKACDQQAQRYKEQLKSQKDKLSALEQYCANEKAQLIMVKSSTQQELKRRYESLSRTVEQQMQQIINQSASNTQQKHKLQLQNMVRQYSGREQQLIKQKNQIINDLQHFKQISIAQSTNSMKQINALTSKLQQLILSSKKQKEYLQSQQAARKSDKLKLQKLQKEKQQLADEIVRKDGQLKIVQKEVQKYKQQSLNMNEELNMCKRELGIQKDRVVQITNQFASQADRWNTYKQCYQQQQQILMYKFQHQTNKAASAINQMELANCNWNNQKDKLVQEISQLKQLCQQLQIQNHSAMVTFKDQQQIWQKHRTELQLQLSNYSVRLNQINQQRSMKINQEFNQSQQKQISLSPFRIKSNKSSLNNTFSTEHYQHDLADNNQKEKGQTRIHAKDIAEAFKQQKFSQQKQFPVCSKMSQIIAQQIQIQQINQKQQNSMFHNQSGQKCDCKYKYRLQKADNRRYQYLKTIFVLLFIEAVTLTFTFKMLK